MTAEEVADYLRVEVVTVRRLVNRGELAAYRVASEFRFMQSDLEAYLQQQRISGNDGFGMPRDRFEKFTERARKVLSLAQKEAIRYQMSSIGTEHLFLGLINEGEGVAVKVLTDLGVPLSEVRNELESAIAQMREIQNLPEMEIGLTPRAKTVISLAVDEARLFGHRYVGTEHILLGIIREEEGIVAQALTNYGVELEKARKQTIQVLNALRSADPPPVPAEAATLVAEGAPSLTCSRCTARCPVYFHNCFNCGNRL